MKYSNIELILTIITSTGNVITRNDKETFEPRPLAPKDSSIRYTITKKARELFGQVSEQVKELTKEKFEMSDYIELMNTDIEIAFTQEEKELINVCLDDYKNLVSEFDEIVHIIKNEEW